MKFLERLANMMRGRNGNDNLNRFIVFIACVVAVINIFFPSIVGDFLPMILIGWCTYRMLSKNLTARRRENSRYLKISGAVKGKLRLIKNKIKDRKTHVYKKCPKCKAILRLPKKKGSHTVACPRCKERFDVKI